MDFMDYSYVLWYIVVIFHSFVNSGNTMKESFQRTDTVFWIDQVNIVTKNILKSDIVCR